MRYGHFDDADRSFVCVDPVTPRPWINYLGNRRLRAFVSQNAGGLLWHLEPKTRRISRYHALPAPGDRPGFYVYIRDNDGGDLWNPHFAPTCAALDAFECRHGPGRTVFTAERGGVRAVFRLCIPPDADAMIWDLSVENTGAATVSLRCASYLEFGLLEFMREVVGWCYLKSHFGLEYDPDLRAIRYDYHVFEAPATPAMLFGMVGEPSGWECSRDAFVGRTGTLEHPEALAPDADLSCSDLRGGGHACGVIARDMELPPGARDRVSWIFALDDDWRGAEATLARFADRAAVDAAFDAVRETWDRRLSAFSVESGEAAMDRFVDTWAPYNTLTALDLARRISTDHMGLDGLRYRDTAQDALGAVTVDPDFALERMRMIFATQRRNGGGCFAFYPDTDAPPSDEPHRCDNTVWPVDTVHALLAETGETALLDEEIPWREGGAATVAEHVLAGLRHIHERRGPHGLPRMFHADWNDGLALFGDPDAESVMLGMQMVRACRVWADIATRTGRTDDAAWCDAAREEYEAVLASDAVWDGAWYRRLLLSDGTPVGSASARQGRIYLTVQAWSVLSGVGLLEERGRNAMDAAREHLDSPHGFVILDPPYRGFPEPEDPPLGSNPGANENAGVFCHANTWAVIAECMLGRGDRAFEYWMRLLPERAAARVGADHYEREPYVYVSTILGPSHPDAGRGGISWLTGTASWMYVAATQHMLGVRPSLDGLTIDPCLPETLDRVRVQRRFRGCLYDIRIENDGREATSLAVDGEPLDGLRVPPRDAERCEILVRS